MDQIPTPLAASMRRVRHKSATARLLIKEARARGWNVLDTSDERLFFLIDSNGRKHPMFGMNTTLNSYTGSVIATLKDLSLLALQDIPDVIPPTLTYTSMQKAQAFLRKHKRIVIKPVGGAHGKGVITNVSTVEDLQMSVQAIEMPELLLQKHVEGREYRCLVVGDECVAIVERKPAHIIGDGLSTVRELIEQKNKNGIRDNSRGTLSKIRITEAEQYIGMNAINTVLAEGQELALTGVSNLSRGGTAIDVTDQVNAHIKRLAVQITKSSGLLICGVDLLIKDIASDAIPGNVHFIELNSQPGIRMHHYPSYGQKRNVASAILDCLEKSKA